MSLRVDYSHLVSMYTFQIATGEASGVRCVHLAYEFLRAKAVAQGAIQYYVQHIVRARVAKWTYGTRAAIRYDPTDPDHLRHQDDVEMSPAGIKFVGGRFDPIVKKVRPCEMPSLAHSLLSRREPL